LPRVILIILILAILAFLVYRFRRLPANRQKKLIKIFLIAALGLLLLVLVLSGRLNWLFAALGALLPLIPRAARLFMGLWPSILPYFRRYQQNKQSSMQTRFMKMQIDMLSGELQGEVLEGEFKGQKLQLMQLEQLLSLLEICRQQDSESAALLAAYLNRTHSGWAGDDKHSYEHASSHSDMSEQQARDILGVAETASKKDIIKAHKHLMQKLHPDRGGSDYLAQQINKARDRLLS